MVTVAAFACLALTAVPADAKTIKCYDAWWDQDGDGHASKQALVIELQVDDGANTCPVGYRDVKDDCDDGNFSIHPYAIERGYDGVDQNCNGVIDEPAFVYDAAGTNNRTDSVALTVLLNHNDIRAAAIAGALYAQIRYFPLRDEGALTTTARSQVADLDGWRSTATLSLSGLSSGRVYAIRVLFWRRNAGGTYDRVGPDSERYYSMTDSATDSTHRRFLLVMKGLYEYHLSEIGYVGNWGALARDGTRYGASLAEAWCSEFYVWVARDLLDGIDGITSYSGLIGYFERNDSLREASVIPSASIGSYLPLDTNQDGRVNHSAMLLAYDSGTGKVWTLEGNYGNQVDVVKRTADWNASIPAGKVGRVFGNVGLISAAMWQ
jgi:hypothetical protein